MYRSFTSCSLVCYFAHWLFSYNRHHQFKLQTLGYQQVPLSCMHLLHEHVVACGFLTHCFALLYPPHPTPPPPNFFLSFFFKVQHPIIYTAAFYVLKSKTNHIFRPMIFCPQVRHPSQKIHHTTLVYQLLDNNASFTL